MKVYALDENLVNKNVTIRMPKYYEWFNLEHIQKVLERKKNELARGIKKLPDNKDWNKNCYYFRCYIEDNWSSVKT